MFANLISKRASSISRMVCSQVHPLTFIYGVDVKSTAKYSYFAAQKISALNYCIKREKYSEWREDWGKELSLYTDLSDYTDFVILAEAVVVEGSKACIHNTFWEVHFGSHPSYENPYSSDYSHFTATLKDILPRNETCHAEILFINDKNSITEKIRDTETRRRDKMIGLGFLDTSAIIRILEEKQTFLKEFENRWAKDVTFVVNGEKCAGDCQYLSAISPVFKKMLQDHAQDEITLEGVESAVVLKDFFLSISPLRVQPNPNNVLSLLKLAHDYDIPFLMRSCEEHLKHCHEIPTADRIMLAVKYNLNGLHKAMTKNLEEKKEKLRGSRKTGTEVLSRKAEESRQKYLESFEYRPKDVTFVVNGEKCAGDRQYLSDISPVFEKMLAFRWRKQDKRMLQDHAQDEITLEGVESADVLKDFFLATYPLHTPLLQPSPTNVVSLLKLALLFDVQDLTRKCEEHLKHCYEISNEERYLLATKYNLDSLHNDIIKILKKEKKLDMLGIESENYLMLLKMAEECFLEKKPNIDAEFLKDNILNEFENRWAKDVTFVVNGEKCAGDRQYLSAISPVFKKMLQDHAQDEITLEGVESADVLKDLFLAISPLRVQPNPTNVVPFLQLAQNFDIPFLTRNCEEYLKQCSEIPAVDRFRLAMKYELVSLKLYVKKTLISDDQNFD
ncbi:BTB/POZ domain-containing protein [Ditylenchus destructor]|nr:BTB/POZ domain-containing protein [Ditylenchus destructor]